LFSRYAPRPIGFHGQETVGGHTLKVYSIHHGDAPFDRAQFRGAWALVAESLPSPDIAAGRLSQILQEFQASDVAVYAVYPHNRYLAPKVRSFVDFVAGRFGPTPVWERF